MSPLNPLRRAAVACALMVITSVWLADDAWAVALRKAAETPSELHRAYYLEHESRDYQAARSLYEEVLSRKPSGEAARVARAGAARCRDALVARNFAAVMPPDAVAYVEIRRPGEIARQISEMLGLNELSVAGALAARPSLSSHMAFHVPSEIMISPAVFDALGAFGGMAIALTDFDVDEDRPPTGVIVLHHGDMTLLRGLLETAFQFAPTAEKIAGLPTFGARLPEIGEVVGILTDGLLVLGTDRALVDGVAQRILSGSGPSLAGSELLKESLPGESSGTFFAFANVQKILGKVKKSLSPRDREEFDRINAVADLESLRSVTISCGVDKGVLGSQVDLRLAEGHHSLLYNFLRLSPLSKECLSSVPSNAAAIFAVGLNPAQPKSGSSQDSAVENSTPPVVTGLDIGRELFSNIRELCVYVVPGPMAASSHERHPHPIPNVGIVLRVNDAKKSRALWNEILKLPGLFGTKEPTAPKQTQIGGQEATQYAIPEFGPVYLSEMDDCIALGLTRNALKATLNARRDGRSIQQDKALGGVLSRVSPDTSILFAGHVGRLAQVAAGADDMEVAMIANPVSQICKDTIAWCAISQSPNRFSMRCSMTGLPQVNDMLKQFSPVINAATGTLMPSDMDREDYVDRKPPQRDKSRDEEERSKRSL